MEIVIADDGSTDATLALARFWASRHPLVQAVASPQGNRGPGAARNRAFRASRGPWIALLDADDTYLEGRLPRLLERARATGADVVSDNLREIDSDGNLLGIRGHSRAGWLDAATFVRRDLGWLQPVVRRSFLESRPWNESRSHGEDFEWSLALLAAGARWWHEPEPGYVYLRGPGTLSSRRLEGLETSWRGTMALMAQPWAASLPGVRRALARRARIKALLWRRDAVACALSDRNWRQAARLALFPFASPERRA